VTVFKQNYLHLLKSLQHNLKFKLHVQLRGCVRHVFYLANQRRVSCIEKLNVGLPQKPEPCLLVNIEIQDVGLLHGVEYRASHRATLQCRTTIVSHFRL